MWKARNMHQIENLIDIAEVVDVVEEEAVDAAVVVDHHNNKILAMKVKYNREKTEVTVIMTNLEMINREVVNVTTVDEVAEEAVVEEEVVSVVEAVDVVEVADVEIADVVDHKIPNKNKITTLIKVIQIMLLIKLQLITHQLKIKQSKNDNQSYIHRLTPTFIYNII